MGDIVRNCPDGVLVDIEKRYAGLQIHKRYLQFKKKVNDKILIEWRHCSAFHCDGFIEINDDNKRHVRAFLYFCQSLFQPHIMPDQFEMKENRKKP